MLFDLLTADEEQDRANVFDVELLGERLIGAAKWLRERSDVGHLPVAYFGASTGAAAALWAVAELRHEVAAMISRGGRPDLASRRLADVLAPTLLIVGARDEVVLELNRQAAQQMRCLTRISVVPALHTSSRSRARSSGSRIWLSSGCSASLVRGRLPPPVRRPGRS